MALARSASGPAGLSINTSSANSLFGSSSTPASGGMFGSTQASKPLFGAAATTTAPQSGGLFGTATSQPAGGLFGAASTSQPQTGGLFGSTTSQPQTGGLFGSAATSQPQAGGLFGSTATTSQPQIGGLSGSTVGGLFGNTNTSQPASSGGLFGSSTTASQPQQTGGIFGGIGLGSQPAQNQTRNTGGELFGGSLANQGSSLFGGGLNAQNQNQPATSLFGGLGSNLNQQSQAQQSTMFPTNQNQTPQPLGGGFLSSNQQQQLAPGVRIDMTNIKGNTRVADLHDDLQKQLAFLDGIILAQEERMTQCQAFMPEHGKTLDNIPSDVEFCSRKMRGLADLMDGDVEAVSALKALVEEDAEHAKLSFRAVDNLKLPPQYHNAGWPTKSAGSGNRSQGNSAARDSQDIVGYFSSAADELRGKLAKYQKNITEIETHLRSVEGSTAQQIHTFVSRRQGGGAAQSDEIRELAESFQDFERGILNVAGKVGGAREKVQSLQLGGFMASNGSVLNAKRINGIY